MGLSAVYSIHTISETMLSYVTSALAFSAPMSKTFDSKAAAAGAAAALSLVAMPVREMHVAR